MKKIQGAVIGAVVWIALRLFFWITLSIILNINMLDIIFLDTSLYKTANYFSVAISIIIKSAALGSSIGWVLVSQFFTKENLKIINLYFISIFYIITLNLLTIIYYIVINNEYIIGLGGFKSAFVSSLLYLIFEGVIFSFIFVKLMIKIYKINININI